MATSLGKTLSFALTLCLITFVQTVISQDLDDVSIKGNILDINGDSISGAVITATLVRTGIGRTVVSDKNGRYQIIELPPGPYIIKVSAPGFAPIETEEFLTISAQNLKLKFTLSPAAVTAEQTIRVSEDDLPAVDTTRTVVGSTLTQTEIEDLPNTSNDVLDLVYSVTGTAEEPLSIRDLAGDDRIGNGSELDQPGRIIGSGIISLSGGAAYSTNITIDGMDNNDDREAGERFQPPGSSVAEVQVITNQFSAEYGRASGGRVNIRTRAGAKKFRGQASLFFEDSDLNANTYNNNRRGLS
ncbi:MAG: carboxypeptidase regulatory-like domain-containing protein, partial [Acidobacteria bacterium]|nr:carboxypeptidase regulatory-like domain-containing protein [Acidobacteriota bacterium]